MEAGALCAEAGGVARNLTPLGNEHQVKPGPSLTQVQ